MNKRRSKDSREENRERNLRYLSVRVTGGVGSWFKKGSRIFWVHLSRPLPRDLVLKKLSEVFPEENLKLNNPLIDGPVFCYAFRTERVYSIEDAWNRCVQALSEACINGP